MSTIKFSVVVPCYNVEQYLSQCIDSLCKQTLKEIEIILVDDGSPDKSGEICDEWAKKDNRIQVIHKKNGGVSAARNDGLALAKGEYIIFCDSDDWLPENALESLYAEGERSGADVVLGDVYRNMAGKNIISRLYEKPFVTKDKSFINKLIQTIFHKYYNPMPAGGVAPVGYGGPWDKAIRLDLLRDNDIKYDSRVKGIFDDRIFAAYVFSVAKTISYITIPVYYYRYVSGSIMNAYKPNALEINTAIFKSWQEFMGKYDTNCAFLKPYYANVIYRFIQILPQYFFNKKNNKSLRNRLLEMRVTLANEPYKSAIKEVERNKLSTYHRLIHKLMIIGDPLLIMIAFKAKETIKKLLRKL